jgi:UPF0755 protein
LASEAPTAVCCLRKFNMARRWLKWIFSVGALFLLMWAAIFFGELYPLFYQPMSVSKMKPAVIVLDQRASAASFVQLLKDQGLISSQRLFLFLIRLQGLSHQLKAGVYLVKEHESAEQFLHRVVAGDVLTKTFPIIDGTTQAQVSADLQSADYLTYHASDWSLVASPFSSAEGLLLADTYYYDAGSHSRQLLEQAHQRLLNYLGFSWQHRRSKLPYKTSYELLIAASIIEKEAASSEERRLISGVIVERLRKKMPLQMDPTVIYARGITHQGTLTRKDLQIDSPYNTYRYRGLPPTPIAMVGKDAIDAAAHPKITHFLYFVAKGDGTHCFSMNYEQQKKAVARYRGTKR